MGFEYQSATVLERCVVSLKSAAKDGRFLIFAFMDECINHGVRPWVAAL